MDLADARRLLDSGAAELPWTRIPALRDRAPRAVEFASLWVKPGRHFNVSYRLTDAGGESVLAAVFLLGESRTARVASQVGVHTAEQPCLHCNTAVAEGGLLLQLFPADYRLPTLTACLDPRRVGDSIGEPTRFTDAGASGYRPGMRCQIRYGEADGGAVFGKVAVEKTGGRALGLQRDVFAAAQQRGGFRVAEPLAYAAGLHLSLVRAGAGESFHESRRRGVDSRDAVQEIARALAAFHRLDLDVERTYTPADEIDLLRSWVDLVATMYPEFAPSLRAAERRLGRHLPEPSAALAFVHRDFYDKQVLLAADGITFLDLDTACRGEAEIDVGNFCAHLQLRGLQWCREGEGRALEEWFLGAYARRLDPGRAAWYRRASLLRLACGYALRPHWRNLVPALIEEGLR